MKTMHDSTPEEVSTPFDERWAWTTRTTILEGLYNPKQPHRTINEQKQKKSEYHTVSDEEYDMEWRLSKRAKKNIISFIIGAAIAFLIYYLAT